MPAALVVEDGLRPEAAHQLDLLLEAAAAVREVLAERLVLDEVPADAEAEPELPVRQQVDLGRLLREQRRLALRRDDDARHELELGRDAAMYPKTTRISWNWCSVR